MPELISPLEMVDDAGDRDPAGAGSESVDELDAIRDLILRAHPDVVPEMVSGETLTDLLASVDEAKSAYARLESGWVETQPERIEVPAGGGAVLPVDPQSLPASEKIRRGLQAARRRQA